MSTVKLDRRMKLTHARAIAPVEPGILRLSSMATYRLPLEQANAAFRLLRDYRGGMVKAAVYR